MWLAVEWTEGGQLRRIVFEIVRVKNAKLTVYRKHRLVVNKSVKLKTLISNQLKRLVKRKLHLRNKKVTLKIVK